MSHFRFVVGVLALSALLIGTAAFAAPPQQPQLVKDQASSSSVSKDEVDGFLTWLGKKGWEAGKAISPASPRTAVDAAEFCESAIDPGGIFCSIGCPSECHCNFGYLASQCCCGLN